MVERVLTGALKSNHSRSSSGYLSYHGTITKLLHLAHLVLTSGMHGREITHSFFKYIQSFFNALEMALKYFPHVNGFSILHCLTIYRAANLVQPQKGTMMAKKKKIQAIKKEFIKTKLTTIHDTIPMQKMSHSSCCYFHIRTYSLFTSK